MITEIEGRMTCTKCGYKWSAMMGDNEVPEVCDCEQQEQHRCDGCGKKYASGALVPVEKLSMRMEAGGTVPSGQCPAEDCGSLCFPLPKPPTLLEAAKRARDWVSASALVRPPSLTISGDTEIWNILNDAITAQEKK